jgi:hypothetical protein
LKRVVETSIAPTEVQGQHLLPVDVDETRSIQRIQVYDEVSATELQTAHIESQHSELLPSLTEGQVQEMQAVVGDNVSVQNSTRKPD